MSIPADNLNRKLIVASADDPSAVHLSLVGNTYTILVSAEDTAGRYSLIDMYVPPGGGPPPHRHDFEESFTVLEGEIEATFRGEKVLLRAGQVIQIPPTRRTNSGTTLRSRHASCAYVLRRAGGDVQGNRSRGANQNHSASKARCSEGRGVQS